MKIFMNTTKKMGGILLVAVSAASFGIMPIFAKIASAAGTSTYSMLFLRFLIAAASMFSLLFVRGIQLPSAREMLAFFLLGAAGYTGQSFCYFTALNHASAGVVALLFYLYPALVMIGSAFFFREKITLKKVAALFLALSGAFVIIGSGFHASPKGIVLSVFAAFFYSAYILVSSKVIKAGMELQATVFIMMGAGTVYGVANLILGFSPPTRPSGWGAVVLLALVSTALALWSFFAGMEKTGPSTAALVSTLEPVVTVLASVFVLSEPITLNIVIGGCLVLASLMVSAMPSREAELPWKFRFADLFYGKHGRK